jgi:hypothetical protein
MSGLHGSLSSVRFSEGLEVGARVARPTRPGHLQATAASDGFSTPACYGLRGLLHCGDPDSNGTHPLRGCRAPLLPAVVYRTSRRPPARDDAPPSGSTRSYGTRLPCAGELQGLRRPQAAGREARSRTSAAWSQTRRAAVTLHPVERRVVLVRALGFAPARPVTLACQRST